MSYRFDCVVAGQICVDIPIRPVPLDEPLAPHELFPVSPIQPVGGGVVCNSGAVMTKLGLRTAAFGFVGNDPWADIICKLFESQGLNTELVFRKPDLATSVTAVFVGENGEHTFGYHSGASGWLDPETILEHLDVFEQSRFTLIGYYALLPHLEQHLHEVLPIVRETGCQVALDTAGGGGRIEPLNRILPHLDYYIPSYNEGVSQTGKREPKDIVSVYRQFTNSTVLGLKLGADGMLLSPTAGEFVEIPAVVPPGEVLDTTGAGDSFYAGFIAGLCHGLDLASAARIGAAAGACCVTGIGAISGIRSFEATAALANGQPTRVT